MRLQNGEPRLPNAQPVEFVHCFLVIKLGRLQDTGGRIKQTLRLVAIPGHPIHLTGGRRAGFQQGRDAVELFLQTNQRSFCGLQFSRGLLAHAIDSLQFQGKTPSRLLNSHLFTFQPFGGGLQLGSRSLQRRHQMTVLQPQQDLAFGNRLARLNLDALDTALDPGPDFCHKAFDRGFSQHHMLASIGTPRYPYSDGCNRQQNDHHDDDNARWHA